MKTKEELNAFKAEALELNAKLSELSAEELEQVIGGGSNDFETLTCRQCGRKTTHEFVTFAIKNRTITYVFRCLEYGLEEERGLLV